MKSLPANPDGEHSSNLLGAFPMTEPLPNMKELINEVNRLATESPDAHVVIAARRASLHLRNWQKRSEAHRELASMMRIAETVPSPHERERLKRWMAEAGQRPLPIRRIGADELLVPSAQSPHFGAVHLSSEHACECRHGRNYDLCWHQVVVRAVTNVMVKRRLEAAVANSQNVRGLDSLVSQ